MTYSLVNPKYLRWHSSPSEHFSIILQFCVLLFPVCPLCPLHASTSHHLCVYLMMGFCLKCSSTNLSAEVIFTPKVHFKYRSFSHPTNSLLKPN